MKICAIDIDGVLCHYPENWIEYVNKTINTSFNDLRDMKNSVSFTQYKMLKQAFRETGEETNAKCRKGAFAFMKRLEDAGYIIVLLTARPIYEIKQVLFDTLEWLRKYQIHYDLIFHGKDKHHKLLKYFKEVDFVVEDNGSVALEIAAAGFTCYLIDNKYNQGVKHINIVRIKDFKEVKI